MNACRYDLDPITGGGFQSRRPPRGHSTNFYSDNGSPTKMMRMGGGFRGNPRGGGEGSGYSRNRYFGGYKGGGSRGYGMHNSRGWGGGNWGGRGNFRGRF